LRQSEVGKLLVFATVNCFKPMKKLKRKNQVKASLALTFLHPELLDNGSRWKLQE